MGGVACFRAVIVVCLPVVDLLCGCFGCFWCLVYVCCDVVWGVCWICCLVVLFWLFSWLVLVVCLVWFGFCGVAFCYCALSVVLMLAYGFVCLEVLG